MHIRFGSWPAAVLTALLVVIVMSPANAGCEGRVFVDLNGNDIRDKGEPGLAEVAVSDGQQVVRTDNDGRYRGFSSDALIFVIKPADYSLAPKKDGLPDFWRKGCGDFALREEPSAAGPLRVLVLADPQTQSLREVRFYQDSIIRAAAHEQGIALGLSLGDITHDDPGLYPALNRATTSLGIPWLHAPGNHDMDLDAASDADSLASFQAIYGPDTYAWEERQAVFIVLDNVVMLPGQQPNYIGGVREEQLAFLRAYLAEVPRDRLLVVAAHIPWFAVPELYDSEPVRRADRKQLFALLQEFPHVLLLSGHSHAQRHVFHGAPSGWHGMTPLHEYNVGAASGALWSGVDDAHGIPHSTMFDGTPKGYATLVIDEGGDYSLAWHPAGLPADDPGVTAAMRLHVPKVLRQGAFMWAHVYANVFMGMDGSRVEYRVDGGDWQPMRKTRRPDPWLVAENAQDDLAPTLRSRERVMEAAISPHLWQGRLPTSLPAGEHVVEVRAFDRWQGEQRASTRYRLDVWD